MAEMSRFREFQRDSNLNPDALALIAAQIAQDRALYDAAGITEPVECSRCGRSVPTFRDASGHLRLEGHRARLGLWCGNGARAAGEGDT